MARYIYGILRSNNNEVSRFYYKSNNYHRNQANYFYDGAVEPYEDSADYIVTKSLAKAVRLA
ncbi:hypothetical protein [Paenibacillus sp. PDC88]|uniref:hypothetical protein n=1 Tax=Paenibacillus sp. PDC88 TaxID=1884375 RepID=UPI00089A9B45|nr:hypothetical protein [Paenibacillus sp. PDC88]SDW24134.1 hypothetical protein SAMN05518848_101761 [Paenibacillus sp. PDC88]